MKCFLFKLTIFLLSIIAIKPVFATDYVVPTDEIIVKPYHFPGIGPGDRLLIPAGKRGPIRFQGFIGEKDNPIIIINSGGKAKVDGEGTYAGIWLYGCEHIRLTGTGDASIEYGIEVYNCRTKGVAATEYTRYFEVDHVEVHDIGGQGIYSDTNYDVRDTWTQFDTYLHHNYVHDTAKAGFYIGYSEWDKDPRPELKGVEISYNIVEKTGRCGIQVGSAVEDVSVHHNVISDPALNLDPQHKWGIQIGRGTIGDWYNNTVLRSRCIGVYIQGQGPFNFYNNIIIRSGYAGQGGSGIRWQNGTNGRIYNNTVVDSDEYGIMCGIGAAGSVYDNLVVGYGSGALSSNILVKETNNVKFSSVSSAMFRDVSSGDYHLTPKSPAVNSGSPSGYAPVDFDGVSKPQQGTPDAGAYEYAVPSSLKALKAPSSLSFFGAN